MKVFLDANVLISVLNKEYPLFTYSARVLSLSGKDNFSIYTSPLCLTISFYFATKKSGQKNAKEKIDTLLNHIHVTGINDNIAWKAIKGPQFHDFEDGMQYYSALESSCRVIVTSDLDDFYSSDIEVLECEAFLKKYFKKGIK